MNKYMVIGNPIDHSLSPKLHNYWIKKNNLNAYYEKRLINENELKSIIQDIRDDKLQGANVTVPFKNLIIPYLDELSDEAKKTQSVNTIYKNNNKIIGHNTDIAGFKLALRYTKYDVRNKKVLILGAGGVVSSIVLALIEMNVSKIIISNRTKTRAENLKKLFNKLEIIEWGDKTDFDMIINATSIGLKKNDEIKIDFSQIEPNKFVYDVIYNPKLTNFLKKAGEYENRTENGKMMFIYQAHQSFTIWHKLMPEINEETINLLEK